LNFYKNKDASGEITPEEISGVNTVIKLLEDEIAKVEKLNITAEKVGKVTTLTITYKDGTEEAFEILDGNDGADGQDGEDYVITPEDYQAIANIVASTINVPTKTSDLTNDSGFIDNTVSNLTNYYNKNQSYNKDEIDGKLSSIYKYKGTVATYSDLPSIDVRVGDVYNVEEDGSNYAWNGTEWDKLGGDVDLSNYYNKTQTDTLLNGKVDNSTLNDYYTKTRTDELLNTKVDKTTYNSKVQELETELGEKIEESDLADYVKDTDYATAQKGGVVKTRVQYGILNGIDGVLGLLYIYKAGNSEIANKQQKYHPIVPANLDYAVKVGVTTNTETLTDEEKGNAQDWLGITESQTAQDELISELQEENKELYDAMAKVAGSGTDVTLNNTAKGKMPIEVSGNTEQDGETSKNLLPNNATTQTINGVTFTKNSDGSYTCNGTSGTNGINFYTNDYTYTSFNAGTYTVSSGLSGESNTTYFLFVDGSPNNNSTISSPTFTLSQTTNLRTRFVIREGITLNNIILKPMIEEGSTATEYHPYGATAPSPDWESPVKIVTGENTVVVGNNNLFDKNNVINNIRLGGDGSPYGDNDYCTSDYLKIKNNTIYSNNKLTGSEAICIYDENKNFIKRWIGSNTTTITTTEKAYYCRVAILKTNLDVFQLEENTTSTSYEEHKETRLPLNLGSIELCKIGEYKDYIWKDETTGKWYVKKMIDKVVLDGTQPSPSLNTSEETTTRLFYNYDLLEYNAKQDHGICNRLIQRNVWTGSNEGFYFDDNSKKMILRIRKAIIGTTENEVNIYLASNNIVAYYLLVTPTDIEITNTTLINQLEAIYNTVKSYKGTTHIYTEVEEGNVAPILDATAIMDLNSLVQN